MSVTKMLVTIMAKIFISKKAKWLMVKWNIILRLFLHQQNDKNRHRSRKN